MEVVPKNRFLLLSAVLFLHLHHVSLAPRAKQLYGRVISYALPDQRSFKKSLGFYEDTYMNFSELAAKYKYTSEEHKVTTEDGYILTLFRLKSKCDNVTKGYPLILQHGIYDTSDEWLIAGPKAGLAYVLAESCYDVWVGNHRGNFYSRAHINLDPNRDAEFWNYTFDEHGRFDIPAMVDYVIKKTGLPKISYIGHSQGTTDFLVMSSMRPEYNDKVHISFLIAPVAWLKYMQSPLPRLLAPISGSVKTLLYEIGFRELFAKHQISHVLVEYLCQFAPEQICGTGFTATTGYKQGNISARNLAVAFGHLLAGISVKDLDHFGQLIATGKFQRYDEGIEGNMIKYGKPRPPKYNVTKISSPVVLICAENDWLSNLRDVNKLRSKLPNVLEYYIVPDSTWSHNDHVYGNRAPKYVNAKILEYLHNYSSNNFTVSMDTDRLQTTS